MWLFLGDADGGAFGGADDDPASRQAASKLFTLQLDGHISCISTLYTYLMHFWACVTEL